MSTDHPVLASIREHVLSSGSYTCHWGKLRREVFEAQPAWINLRAWCAANDLECDLCFGESSKQAEVHFRKAGPAPILRPEAPAPVEAVQAPTPA
jgi:hypothetical protein